MNRIAARLSHPLLRSGRDDCAPAAHGRMPPRPQQRVVTLGTGACAALSRRGSLTRIDTGANIYVAANPLRPGSRKRTKESIASVRHLYIDIDDGRRCPARCAAGVGCWCRTPTAILSTSPGKYQALWRVEGFDFDAPGTDAQAARHRLRRRSRLHRLQPGASRPRFPESEVRSRPPCHGRISRRFDLESRRLPA